VNVSTFRVHPPGDLQSGREANVVGVGFEREAEDGNTLPFYPDLPWIEENSEKMCETLPNYDGCHLELNSIGRDFFH
jgi:hypothetical protein